MDPKNKPGQHNEIVNSRVVKAPRETVFKMWSDPAHLKEWWGPEGFSNSFEEFEFRPGGRWKFVMHGPEKGNYPNECIFTKIEPPLLIAWDRISQPIFKMEFTFEKVDANSTRIIFKMIFGDPGLYKTINKFAPGKNEENLDRLEAELEKVRS